MTTYRILILVVPESAKPEIDIRPSIVNTRISGLAAARPSAPNAFNCYYLATDSGVVTESDGTSWSTRSRALKRADFTGIMTGLAAARPANGAAIGWLYYATDSGAFSEGFPTGWATLYFEATPGVATVPVGFGPATPDSWQVNDADLKTISAASTTIPAGHYAASTLVTADADLVTGNIRAGVTILGVAGKTSVVETSTGTAVAADIATGKKAWVNGIEITGVA